MKTLKNYLVESVEMKRKYVSITYTPETQEKLRSYCDNNGFDLTVDFYGNEQLSTDFKFHTTIFYTTSKHSIENTTYTLEEPKTVEPVSFELLGAEKDIPVIKVMSDDIIELREFYKSEYGMEDEWPDWKPHISLTYTRTTEFPENIQLPDFSLMYDKISIEDGALDV